MLIWWIFPLPPHPLPTPTPLFFLSFFLFLSLCLTAFHNIVSFFLFYYKAPCKDIYVHVHFSWNSHSADLPVATLHSLKVISSLDKTRIWGTVSHPLSQMRTEEGMAISTLWHQQKDATEAHNLWEARFFLLHEITIISGWGKGYEFYSVFSVFIVKNIGNICESRKSSSQGTFFKERLV